MLFAYLMGLFTIPVVWVLAVVVAIVSEAIVETYREPKVRNHKFWRILGAWQIFVRHLKNS